MNKQKRLRQSLIKLGAICAFVVVGCVGAYMLTSELLDGSRTKKEEAERSLLQDRSRASDMQSQLEKSGIAEKRFLATQSMRSSTDYTGNSETLKDWIKNKILLYRLSGSFKLNLTTDKPVQNPALNGTSYEVLEHPGMKMEFSSITDTHTFSLLNDLLHDAPGFIVIDSLSMKRLADVDKNVVSLLRSGNSPYMIETKLTFNWIGLREKVKKDPAASPAAPSGVKP